MQPVPISVEENMNGYDALYEDFNDDDVVENKVEVVNGVVTEESDDKLVEELKELDVSAEVEGTKTIENDVGDELVDVHECSTIKTEDTQEITKTQVMVLWCTHVFLYKNKLIKNIRLRFGPIILGHLLEK